jgi:hypothetical protein
MGGAGGRVRLQSAVIIAAVSLVGVAFVVAGSPWWVAALYAVLGAALALVRARIGRPASERRRAIGYIHTSSAHARERSAAVRRFCEARGIELTTLVHDSGEPRESLAWALAQLEAGAADVLVVGRLQDLSSDVASLAPLLKWFAGGRRTLIAVDLVLDTSTEAGRIAARAIADVGSWDAPPARPPRPAPAAAPTRRIAVADVPELQARIRGMRDQGLTLQAIADTLNAEGVPTLRGGALWRPSSVQRATGYRRPSRGIEVD